MTIDDQIKCVRREIAMRRQMYPKWVASGRLKKGQADHEIAAMEAVLATLDKVAVATATPRQGRIDRARQWLNRTLCDQELAIKAKPGQVFRKSSPDLLVEFVESQLCVE